MLCDVVDAEGALVRTAPRTVLRRVVERLEAIGFQARVGVELELHLLNSQGVPLTDGVQCYSLAKLGELDPVLERIFESLDGIVEIEGANTEYGPGQVEVNIAHAPPLHAADDATRLKYCVRDLARRGGALATFMAKPFAERAGNSMHLHVSLWRDGEPAFVSLDRSQSNVMRASIGGVLRHLPGIVLYGAPTVNSYKRFEPASFAPATQTWGGDNRTVAVRALLQSPASARLELRTPGADGQPIGRLPACWRRFSRASRPTTIPVSLSPGTGTFRARPCRRPSPTGSQQRAPTRPWSNCSEQTRCTT